jgi:tRNA-splicing ligase RtcB (3'-phosphate/5'-hydroxy nucleic acid ligase)
MKIIKNNAGNSAIIFTDNLEQEAWDQVKTLANTEAYQDEKIRIMPDAHAGKGCTIGTTMTISDKVTPNLVGVDIGCGMLTVALKDNYIDYRQLDQVIRSKVPGGFHIHSKPQRDFDFSNLRCKKHVDIERAAYSIGSLGGGNHFIEIEQSDRTGIIYLVIHSGSRKLGGDVCKHYQDKAARALASSAQEVQKAIDRLKATGRQKEIGDELKRIKNPAISKELAWLSGEDFDDYMNDMAIVQKFASVNRETIARIILHETGLKELSRFETIHNYIDFRRMILRKGAVSAEKGETLLIPVNMRDGSLLCVGKGNAEWNYSAPHGAGRLMSRSKAKQVLNMEEFKASMKGIYTTSVIPQTLDEAPQAYKPVEEITSFITDTVEISETLKPLYNFKAY